MFNIQVIALGPLLFLIYVNDMPLQVSSGRLLQFADDTTLICSGDSFEMTLCMNEQLDHLCGSITGSKMQLNCRKSSIMWFSTKPAKVTELPVVSGIIFDDILQWSSHIDKVCHIICA